MAIPMLPCAGVQSSSRAPILIHPAFRRLPPPVIVIGMHRSGTSLVSGMLSHLGAYMDPDWEIPLRSASAQHPTDLMRRSGYGEAVAFRKLNERILRRAGSDWDNAGSFLCKRGERAFTHRSIVAMQFATFRSLKSRYLDLAPPHNLAAWGWKDPRTSLTLPYWLKLFPSARVIHVRRQLDGVIRSLEQRASQARIGYASPAGILTRLSRIASDPAYRSEALRKRLGIKAEQKDRPTPTWIELTETYVRECEKSRSLCDRYLELEYEDILHEPYSHSLLMARFAEISPDPVTLRRAADFVIRDPVHLSAPDQSDALLPA